MIANETAASPALLDTLRERASAHDLHVTVIAPISEPRHGYVVYQDTRRASAGRRLEKTLGLLRSSSIPAQGFVADTSPVQAAKDALEQLEPRAGRDHRLDPSRATLGLAAPRRRPRDHARRGWCARHPRRRLGRSRDRRAERARGRERDRALEGASRPRRASAPRSGPASFLIVAPQSGEVERPEAARRLRRALSELRSEGIDVHGQVVAPRPVHRGARGDQRRARRRDHRLDLPERALGLAAARPDRAPAQRDRAARRPRRLGEGERARRAARSRPQPPTQQGNANEHPPPIHYSSRINPAIVGIFLFIGSEIMLFGSFFTVYFFDRVVNAHAHPGPVAAVHPGHAHPVGAAVVPRARQHADPRHLELHDALGADLGEAGQPRRPLRGDGADAAARVRRSC